jgi:hypothetical protein
VKEKKMIEDKILERKNMMMKFKKKMTQKNK